MENVMPDPNGRTYKPLTTEQKLAVREAQVQLQNLKDAVQNANQNVINVITNIGTENGLTKTDNVEFRLDTLEFVTKQ
jgi:ribosomal protein S3AE